MDQVSRINVEDNEYKLEDLDTLHVERVEFVKRVKLIQKILIISLVFFGVIGLLFFDWRITLIVLIIHIFVISTHKWLYILSKTYKRDYLATSRFVKLRCVLRNRTESIPKQFLKCVEKHPNKVAFQLNDRKLTFCDIQIISNQIGNYFKTLGYQHGDCIAIFMETSPEYICLWLGLSKIGVVSALINTNLRNDPLIHSIKSGNSKALIYSNELRDAICDIRNQEIKPFNEYFQYYEYNENEVIENSKEYSLRGEILKASKNDLDLDKLKGEDKLMYIYTSGTTGLPKPAIITHIRYTIIGVAPNIMAALSNSDILYTPLPIYHTAGGVVGTGHAVLLGGTVVLRKKFSATNFWKDCIKYECTAAQYIGEICRFLLATPPQSEDQLHKIKILVGNGLKLQIWKEFTKRFNVKHIYELYGATEGNANLFNIDSKIGAVGFMPFYGKKLYPVGLIKCNVLTGEIIRNNKGLCIPCKPYEPGLIIGKIDPLRSQVNSFSGYADNKESDKKIIRNVFTKNDMYFNSGDVLIKDEFGYMYFKDRTGDTFRWKGENVATNQVEDIISMIVGLNDTTVYGVTIPKIEGKAGMCAILDPNGLIDWEKFKFGIDKQLPKYAHPIFVRIMNELPMTGTFKLQKRELQVQGFDITKINDRIYVLINNNYVLLSPNLYSDILNGLIKF